MEGKGSSPGRRRRRAAGKRRDVLVALVTSRPSLRATYDGIESWAAERGLRWKLRFIDSRRTFRRAARWMTREGLVSGAITEYHEAEEVELMALRGVPTVYFGPDSDAPTPCDHLGPKLFARVMLDAPAVIRMALDYFSGRTTFRSFGYVENYWDIGWSVQRGNAWDAETARRGLPASRFFHFKAPSTRSTDAEPDLHGLAAWLRGLEKPAAVLCANDFTAADVLALCDEAGISVPRQVALLGMDDNALRCELCDPNLSSVRFDGVKAGRLMAWALAEMMEGRDAPPPERLLYGAECVVQRASTGAVSTAGAMVQRALDFIEANATRRISLDDVARHVGVSRALATLRFRQLQGESILQAINRVRLAKATGLLSETSVSLASVAAASGFGSVDSLRRALRGKTGAVPSAIRRARR